MRSIALAAMVVALMGTAAFAATETEYLIASWENTMNHFGTGGDFDASAFDTLEGVTNGSTSLLLDVKSGWHQGLRTAYVDGLNPDFTPFFPQLEGAKKLRLDVTSSKSYMNITSGIQLFVFIQGQSGNGTPQFGFTSPYILLNSPYVDALTTETIEFDLTHDANGNPVAAIPAFSTATGGWFDMRIGYNVSGSQPNAGFMFFDNLRSVKIGGTILGDFNGNGSVGIEDYTTWADHFGMAKGTYLAAGSFVTDGSIGIDDYTTWADNFGHTAAVPEPATMALLGLGALGLIRRRR